MGHYNSCSVCGDDLKPGHNCGPDTKPEWDAAISESEFGGLYTMLNIDLVKTEYRQTGVDTAEGWIMLANTHLGKTTEIREDRWNKFYDPILNIKPTYRGIVHLNYRGKEIAKVYEERKKWEEQHKSDRKEYERLKAKFGDS